jgi:hypothetical protein
MEDQERWTFGFLLINWWCIAIRISTLFAALYTYEALPMDMKFGFPIDLSGLKILFFLVLI